MIHITYRCINLKISVMRAAQLIFGDVAFMKLSCYERIMDFCYSSFKGYCLEHNLKTIFQLINDSDEAKENDIFSALCGFLRMIDYTEETQRAHYSINVFPASTGYRSLNLFFNQQLLKSTEITEDEFMIIKEYILHDNYETKYHGLSEHHTDASCILAEGVTWYCQSPFFE